jgi:hypothetical protein
MPRARQLHAHVNVAFAFGQIGDLVCPIDHPRSNLLRLAIVGDLKDRLYPQGTCRAQLLLGA